MSNFLKSNYDPLDNVIIKAADRSHISIKNKDVCIEECENKPCTFYCPSRVYSWSDKEMKIIVDYARCIECGSCPWGCPYDNIKWAYPPGGFGVKYKI